MSTTKLDPELLQQIAAAEKANRSVAAVFFLAPTTTHPLPAEKATQSAVKALLKRVGKRVGESPEDVTVFGNIGSFALVAPAKFVKHLARQKEVASAIANLQSQDMLIHPVSSKQVKLPGIRKRR
jgi:hypothetical protein